MSRFLILGGQVVDPAARLSGHRDLVIDGSKIASVSRPGSPAARPRRTDFVLDASGLLVLPGLIDLHVHLRDPGRGEAEDMSSGTRAAAAGGFTTVVCMPNTHPVLDRPERLRRLMARIRKHALVRVLPAVALSMGLRGRKLAPVESLAREGAVALSDDGIGTSCTRILGEALQRGMECGLSVLAHCEDHRLSSNGVMHLGPVARRLGLPGIPAAAEMKPTRRALRVTRRFSGRLHLQHISTAGSLAAVRRAKQQGLPVSCEVTPHHLFLTVDQVEETNGPQGPDPNLKMNPPLRSAGDRQAIREGLSDGTVDAIASDHAPHSAEAKRRGFLKAPFGVTGLETTLPLVLRLVEEGVITLERAVGLLSCGPAAVLGINAGTLNPGDQADVTVVDPRETFRVVPSRMKSRSRNTAFSGWTLRGKVKWTIVGGRVVHPTGRRSG